MHIIYISLYIVTAAIFAVARLCISHMRFDDLADADKENFILECIFWPITLLMYLVRR